MALSIKVNGTNLSLVHKGSMGVVMSTLPDVCKTPTPGGPVPIPYPVIVSVTQDLTKGSKSVVVDGGNPAAIKGSELSRCTGDEPGTAMGIKSNTQMKETSWLSYSFDVMIEGKNACRLGDKLQMNHGNTVCLAGILQPAIIAAAPDAVIELQILCNMMCEEKDVPGRKQDRIAAKLKALDAASGGRSTMKAEVPFDPSTVEPYMSQNEPWRATNNWFIPGHRRPDVVITNGGPPTPANIRRVVEMKFNDGSTPFSKEQKMAYEEMFGDKLVTMEEGVDCVCEDDEEKKRQPKPVPVPVPAPAPQRQTEPQTDWWDVGKKVAAGVAVVVLGVATVAAAVVPFDGPVGEIALGTATAAVFAWGFTTATVPPAGGAGNVVY